MSSTENQVEAFLQALNEEYGLGTTVTGRVVHLIDFNSDRNIVNYRDGNDLSACSMVGDYEEYTGERDEVIDSIRGSGSLVCTTCVETIDADDSRVSD